MHNMQTARDEVSLAAIFDTATTAAREVARTGACCGSQQNAMHPEIRESKGPEAHVVAPGTTAHTEGLSTEMFVFHASK